MSYMEITVRDIGNSKGIILPKEILDDLRINAGDTLYLTKTHKGINISSLDPEVARQIDIAVAIMDEERDVLSALAKL